MSDTAEPRLELRPTVVSRLILLPVLAVSAPVLYDLAGPVAAAAVVVGYLACWLLIARRRVIVDDDGVTLRGSFATRRLGWDQIESYGYWSAQMGAAWHGVGPERAIDNPAASVRTVRHHLRLDGGGARIVIDSSYRDAQRAAGRALREVHRRLRARGVLDLDVAPFAIEVDGLVHRTHGRLSWAELEKVALTGEAPPTLRVMKHGKALAWAAVSMKSIRNSMLFLEHLAERGVAIDLGPVAFATDQLLARLTRR